MPERYMGLVCLFFIGLLIVIFSHIPEEKNPPKQKYDIGDIVYLTLDDNKGQITNYNSVHKYYTIRVKTEAGYQDIKCKEAEFTVKAEKE